MNTHAYGSMDCDTLPYLVTVVNSPEISEANKIGKSTLSPYTRTIRKKLVKTSREPRL